MILSIPNCRQVNFVVFFEDSIDHFFPFRLLDCAQDVEKGKRFLLSPVEVDDEPDRVQL